MEGIRINKFLSEAGVCSRRGADSLLEEGRVMINGRTAVIGEKVLPQDIVMLDGKELKKEEEEILLLVNKPVGIVCTTTDKQGDNNIVDFLNYPKRIYPVGRLDKDSCGLLLMTNQGELVNKIMRAGNFHEKEYFVEVDRKIDDDFVRRMSLGVYLRELEATTRPCRVKKLDEKQFSIVLTQGLNRQIRRMCQELGRNVVFLERRRIMNLRLGNLGRGKYREITSREKDELLALLAGSRSEPLANGTFMENEENNN